jgi:hypothetical protein
VPLDLAILHVRRAAQLRVAGAQVDQGRHKPAKAARVGLCFSPVEPVEGPIVAVGVVVAALGVPILVPHVQHGDAVGQEERCREVARLPSAQPGDGRVVGRPFLAAVPGKVVRFAVAEDAEGRWGVGRAR